VVLQGVFAMVLEGDPLETYLAMMERSLAEDLPSQLGLARIRYETGAQLRLTVNRGNVLVEADFAIPRPENEES
ncbi:MAG: hypothetical protein JWM80_965, partial [Cyanobacteria bacterium RYN_339]|nr:hypothetical protein [Cyanobacteria bacterium RYN_339]